MTRIRRGLDVPIAGQPKQAIENGPVLRSVALMGADYPGMLPTMKVKEGEQVIKGQALFTDKQNPSIVYTAPASGLIRAVNRGARRVFQSLVIDLDENQGKGVEFTAFKDLNALTAEQVKEQLLASGLWTAIRTRPFGKVPAPQSTPSSLFINAMDSNPLAANPEVVISAAQDDFNNGVTVLSKLVARVFVTKAAGTTFATGPIQASEFSGPHPAGLVGTHIHFLDPVSAKRTAWHLNYQDVIAIGRLFSTGELDSSRVISLAGPVVKNPRLVRTLVGAAVSDLTDAEVSVSDYRVISGSVLSGRTAKGVEAYVGRYHLQVSILEEGREREMLHYLRPGANSFSVLNTYLGKLLHKTFNMTTTTNGSARAMVPVGTYEQVMPLDILPTQLLRSILVGDTDTAQALGCLELEEEDLGLCTYVCPGKYEYGPILRDVLTRIEVEG